MHRSRPLVTTNWQRDRVYLVQFPRAGSIPSISPYCLKLETWLRVANVPYENVSNNFTKTSGRGQLPFIEINGQQIPDSNLIIERLTKMFGIKIDEGLDAREIADRTAYSSLIEDTIKWQIITKRWRTGKSVFTSREGFGRHFVGLRYMLFDLIFAPRIISNLRSSSKKQGTGVLSPEEIEAGSERGFTALETYLGSSDYFFGSSPSTFDCTVFGHVSMVYFTSLSPNLKKYIKEKTPFLAAFMERMRAEWWPDWDECCARLSLTTKPNVPAPLPSSASANSPPSTPSIIMTNNNTNNNNNNNNGSTTANGQQQH